MADSPASQVYSPGVLGDATVLGSGLGPLTVMRQEAAAQAKARANAARLKQQQEESDARNFVPVTGDGWGVHNQQISDMTQQALALNKADYLNPSLTPYERKSRGFARANQVKQAADASNEMKADHAAKMALAGADKRYDSAKVNDAYMGTLYNKDPETGARTTDIPIPQVDIKQQQNVLDRTDVLNKNQVYQTFIKNLADEENVRIGKAALPGGFGNTTVFDSNIFAHDKDGNPVYNADRSSKIANMPRLLARMQDDPFVRKVLQQDAIDNQNAAGAQQMQGLNYEQLSPAQNAQMQALPTAGAQQTQVNSATDISRYGKTKTSSVDSYRPPIQPRQPRALKANEATATDTDGQTLDVPVRTESTTSTVFNNDPLNQLGFIHKGIPQFVTTGTKETPYTSHYAKQGTSFSTSKNPHINLSVPTDGITVLGSDGVPSKYYGSSSNTMTDFKANARVRILELDGKRMAGQGDPTTQTGRAAQHEIMARATPEERRHIKFPAYYEGSVVDKGKTSGDGPGGDAKVIGYKDGAGNPVPIDLVPDFTKKGIPLTKIYDPTVTMSRAIHLATRELDAQAKAQTPGYDPSVLTAGQQEIANLVLAGGGEVPSPYTSGRAAAAPVVVKPGSSAGGAYERKAAPAPVNKSKSNKTGRAGAY